MRRIERRLIKLNDELKRLRREEELVAGELEMHMHIDDDARRDAVVGGPADRAEAYQSAKDVRRFRRALEHVRRKRRRAEAKRDRILLRLGRP